MIYTIAGNGLRYLTSQCVHHQNECDVIASHPYYDIALRCYYSQARKLSSKLDDKKAILSAMEKLKSMHFVAKVDELSDEQKKMIETATVKYYIPWLAAWNPNSVSTSC